MMLPRAVASKVTWRWLHEPGLEATPRCRPYQQRDRALNGFSARTR